MVTDIKKLTVREVELRVATPFFINMHYAQRVPSVSYLYGLYDDEILLGVLSIGKPASLTLCNGVCGVEHSDKVYELNRLIVKEGLPKNTLSFFVSKVLKLLSKEDLIIISYADTGAGHNGYIYQATNFIYTGITSRRTDLYNFGKHARHSDDTNKNLRRIRTAKHRYIYFTKRSQIKGYTQLLKYEIKPYPKFLNSRYVLGSKVPTLVEDTSNGLIYREYTRESSVILGKPSLLSSDFEALWKFYMPNDRLPVCIEFKDGSKLQYGDFLCLILSPSVSSLLKCKNPNMRFYSALYKYYVLFQTMKNLNNEELVDLLQLLAESSQDIIFNNPSIILGALQFDNVYLGCNLLGEKVKSMSRYFVSHREEFTTDLKSIDAVVPGSKIVKISLM